MLLRPSIKKRLCCSSIVARQQASTVNSLTMRVVFDERLASHVAAVALVVRGHLVQYELAAIYTSLCEKHRYVLTWPLDHIDDPHSRAGIGPLRILRDDLTVLEWIVCLEDGSCGDTHGCCCWIVQEYFFFRRAGFVIGGG